MRESFVSQATPVNGVNITETITRINNLVATCQTADDLQRLRQDLDNVRTCIDAEESLTPAESEILTQCLDAVSVRLHNKYVVMNISANRRPLGLGVNLAAGF